MHHKYKSLLVAATLNSKQASLTMLFNLLLYFCWQTFMHSLMFSLFCPSQMFQLLYWSQQTARSLNILQHDPDSFVFVQDPLSRICLRLLPSHAKSASGELNVIRNENQSAIALVTQIPHNICDHSHFHLHRWGSGAIGWLSSTTTMMHRTVSV